MQDGCETSLKTEKIHLSKWGGGIVAFVYRLTDNGHLGSESLYCGKDNKLEILLCLGMFQFQLMLVSDMFQRSC